MEWFSDDRRAIGGSAVLAGLIVAVMNDVQGDAVVGSIALAAVVVASLTGGFGASFTISCDHDVPRSA